MDPLDPLNPPPPGDFSIELPAEPAPAASSPEPGASAAPAAPSEFDAQCLEALAALSKTVTQLGLYGPEHPSVMETMKGAESLIGSALAAAPQKALIYVKDRDKWVVNGRIIGNTRQVGGPVSTLIDRYKLSSVTLRAGLETRELIVICQLAALPFDQKVDARQFLAENNVANILLNEAVYAEVGPDGKPAGKGAGEGGADDPAQPGQAAGEPIQKQIEGQSLEASIQLLVKKVARTPDEEFLLFKLIMEKLRKDIEKNVEQATIIVRKEKGVVEFERARTENILSNVGAGAIVVDEQGKILMMNPAAEEIYGAKLAEVAGKPVNERSDAQRVVALAAEIEAAIDKPLNKDIEVRGSDKTKMLIRSSWAVVKNEGGRVVGMVLALTDLAAHKKVEAMQNEFVAHMTHELRSPLASIQAGLELLMRAFKNKLDEQQTSLFTACLANTARLSTLVTNILDFSKLESGQMNVYPKVCDPNKICSQAVDGLRPWATKKQINLTFSPDPNISDVLADEGKIVQVLVNLISNSLKFTPKQGTVAVGAAVLPSEPGFVTFAVRDNGCGIPPADRQRVFEKFQQVASPQNVGGTGLGLPIAKSMVELHEGRMWLESEVGRGTAFYFTIPVKPAAKGPATPPPAPKPWWKRLLGLD